MIAGAAVPGRRGGYAVLAMLAVMLGVGGGWMAVAGSIGQGAASTTLLNTRTRHDLVDARQALISYSVLYPFMYGPASAGPGHFPCPDTDGLTENGLTIATGVNQRRDGPNPPCSALNWSEGRLPRHVVLPGNRYLFHSHFRQHYQYTVAGDVVNNPLNRNVNLSDMLNKSSRLAAVEISIPDSGASTDPARVVITENALADATASSVAAWVIQRSEHSVSASADSTALPPDACDENSVERVLLDHPLVHGDLCVEDSLAMNTIEGVPAVRHWFIRNKWHKVVQIQRGESCNNPATAAVECSLVYPLAMRKAMRDSGAITLLWNRSP